MKAILAIELKDDVNLNDIEIRYVIQDKYGTPIKAEVDGCPLRPLPERKHPDGEATIHTGVSYEQGYIDGHEHGWDACLYEITGETE